METHLRRATAVYAGGMEVPIACSLADSAAQQQLEEWHRLLATAAVAIDRVSPTELSARLPDVPELVAATLRLAQREKACCPFFDFTLQIEAEAIVLHIRVPEDAAALLDDFVGQDSVSG